MLNILLSVAVTQALTSTLTTSSSLTLNGIRSTLVRLEETIIFSLIERAQFRANAPIYEPSTAPPGSSSLLEYMLRETESVHARARRYSSPDESPFFPVPEDRVLPPLNYPAILAPFSQQITANDEVLETYLRTVVPRICAPGDDAQCSRRSAMRKQELRCTGDLDS